MDSFDYVLVGGGPASLSAVESIRGLDLKGSLLWVSDESNLPYSKVLLPHVLSGKVEESRLTLIGREKLEELKVEFWRESPALSLNVDRRILELRSGKAVGFRKLLIASGASPFFPKITGIETQGVFGLRTLNDVHNVRKRVKRNAKIVILGGGLVGTQVANALSVRGIPSSLVVSSSHILSQILDPEAARFTQRHLGKRGPTLHLNEDPLEIRSDGEKVSSVVLKSGKELEADLVVVGKGVKPNIDFLTESKVQLNWGVLVDERMATNIPDIYAAGDVAVSHDFLSGDRSYTAVWPKAIEEGRVAGRNMAGAERTYSGALRMNITTIFGITVAAVGDVRSGGDGRDTLTFRDKGMYRIIVVRDGRIIGMALIGSYADVGVLTHLIRSQVPLNRFLRDYKGDLASFNRIYEEIIGQT